MFKRIIRLILVVAPVLAAGFYLGVGWSLGGERRRIPEPVRSVQTREPELVFEKKESPGNLVVARAAKLLGGKLAEAEMKTTTESLRDAIQTCDTESLKLGWSFNEDLTRAAASADADSTVRVYRKSSGLRVIVIGPPLDGERLITVFRGSFGK